MFYGDLDSPSGIFLSYASSKAGDGLGAQAQRLMGIFSASRQLGLGYLHNPIQAIEMNPGDPSLAPEARMNSLNQANSLFSLPSDINYRPRLRFSLRSLNSRRIRFLVLADRVARSLRIPIVVELPSSLPWSDQYPSTYQWAAELIEPRFPQVATTTRFRIDVHIRRAVAPQVGREGTVYDRYVPTDWYLVLLHIITDFLKERGIKWRIRIHTDMPKERWKVPADTSPGTLQMWHHHNLIDDEGYLVDMGEDPSLTFSHFEDVEICQEWAALDALTSMVNADALIMCASSFSYVAGLLRQSRLTLSPVFFHSSLPTWKCISHLITQDERREVHDALIERWPPPSLS